MNSKNKMPDETKMLKVGKDEKFSRSTRKSFKKKCESMIPKDESGQPKLKIAGKYTCKLYMYFCVK